MVDDIAEFLPIKLSPGFITIAFHLGCIGCNFCSVRYGTRRDSIFRSNQQAKYPTSPAAIVKCLSSMPSFAARMPIRIGNDTDYRFEAEEVREFVSLLPSNYPVAVLSRFPVLDQDRSIFSKPNVVLKLTATPRSDYLDCPDNALDVVDSLRFRTGPVVLTLGPIVADNFEATRECLRRVKPAPNVSIYLKMLNDEFHASLQTIPTVTRAQIVQLKTDVREHGLRHMSQLMCAVNGVLGLTHKRVMDVPIDERQDCDRCASRLGCYSEDKLDTEKLDVLLRGLSLRRVAEPERRGYKDYFISVDRPTGLGDEAYLSEMLKVKIKSSGTLAGTAGYKVAALRDVLSRWDSNGFFPAASLLAEVEPFLERVFARTKAFEVRK